MRCSPGLLANTVSNLLGNAIKDMEESDVRRVAVRATESRGLARIVVEDSGPGIPRHYQPVIFEPFTRAAPSGVTGFGLGLATVQRLTAALGGAVGFASQEGAGSTFWVELPRANPPRAEAAEGAK